MELDQVWKLCLQMWDAIFSLSDSVLENKASWMKENGFVGVLNDCFFCQFAHDEYSKVENSGFMCDFCPAVQVDPKFDCIHQDYHYLTRPKEFKYRVKQLNKKRLG